jgi:hypothetical protein
LSLGWVSGWLAWGTWAGLRGLAWTRDSCGWAGDTACALGWCWVARAWASDATGSGDSCLSAEWGGGSLEGGAARGWAWRLGRC